LIAVADGTAWRLVSQCATVEDLVRVFRTLASADGLTGIPVSGIGPGGRSQVRLVVALSSKAAVLDGDAVMTRDAGTVSVRFVKIDARGKGLLAHMVEHRDDESPPAVPRHLIPLGAAAGTPATARGDSKMAKCVFEPMGVAGGAASRVASAAAAVPDVASTVRMPGARQAAPPTIRDSGPPSAMVGAVAPAAPGSPGSERPKREVQKTLMGMPTLGRSKSGSSPPPVAANAAPAPVMAPHTSSGATTTPVVATGTPPVGLDHSKPVPKGGVELKETGPTQPTRGAGVASPAVVAAAQAIAATPATAFDDVATVRTAQGAVRRVESAPSGPVDDLPTIPNEDIVTDVSVSLPDLPSGDYIDPIIDPPAPAMVHSPVPAPPPAAVYAVAGSSPGWQMPPQPPMGVPVVPGSGPYGALPQPYYPTPYPGVAPMMIERDEDMTEMVQLQRVSGRSRWPVIAVTSGVIVIGVAVMVVVAARSGGEKPGKTPLPPPAAKVGSAPASAAATAPGSAAASAVETAPPPGETCKVWFTSSPDATDVVVGGKVIGTTPFNYDGSCAAFKVTFRREKYQSQTKEIAPGTTTFEVRLERPQFRVKVTSRPPGAMVKVGGEDRGKTPVTIALPGFETTSIELVKGGVTTTQRVYAGKTGQKVDVKLKTRR